MLEGGSEPLDITEKKVATQSMLSIRGGEDPLLNVLIYLPFQIHRSQIAPKTFFHCKASSTVHGHLRVFSYNRNFFCSHL